MNEELTYRSTGQKTPKRQAPAGERATPAKKRAAPKSRAQAVTPKPRSRKQAGSAKKGATVDKTPPPVKPRTRSRAAAPGLAFGTPSKGFVGAVVHAKTDELGREKLQDAAAVRRRERGANRDPSLSLPHGESNIFGVSTADTLDADYMGSVGGGVGAQG